MNFSPRIIYELKESKIDLKVALMFIPIAFFTYLFHEFGHWSVGEFLGNEMTYSLNSSNSKSGVLKNDSDNILISIGGPAFTILQALLFLFITKITKSIYAYSVVFFAMFNRFFSIIFGGFSEQDEARIALMLETNDYLVAFIVLTTLLLIIWRCNIIMKLKMNSVGYFVTLSTIAIVIVIGVNELIK